MLDRRNFLKACVATSLLSPVAVFAKPFGTRHERVLKVPSGYIQVAHEKQVPPLILFGVALQESKMKFGGGKASSVLPWPWTLNVRGVPMRFAKRKDAVRKLSMTLANGETMVDIGPMQVCWRYHKDRFPGVSESLEPYTNLRAGADILTEEYRNSGNWFDAVGRYHAPNDAARANSYATSVFQRLGMSNHA